MRELQIVLVGDCNALFAGQHALAGVHQQRFGLCGLFSPAKLSPTRLSEKYRSQSSGSTFSASRATGSPCPAF
jgi:hypothetical protein